MKAPRAVGRYELLLPLASGGMATVFLGRQRSQLGFQRTVAIKQLHQHYAEDPDLVAMPLDEARIVSRIRHANVVPTLDVVAEGGELLVVMEYVEGETLANLLRLAKATGQTVLRPSSFPSSSSCWPACTPPTRRRTRRASLCTWCTETSPRRT